MTVKVMLAVMLAAMLAVMLAVMLGLRPRLSLRPRRGRISSSSNARLSP